MTRELPLELGDRGLMAWFAPASRFATVRMEIVAQVFKLRRGGDFSPSKKRVEVLCLQCFDLGTLPDAGSISKLYIIMYLCIYI